MRALAIAAAALVPFASGCSSFAAVRSADVRPGASFGARASIATPPGDDAAWFWSFYCASGCDHWIASGEIDFTYGWQPEDARSREIGVGINGLLNPFVEGYLQLREGDRPMGVGARLGIPVPWSSSTVYARVDFPHAEGRVLMLNPTLFIHHGNSPNGANAGFFFGVAPAGGLLLRGGRLDMTVSLSPVVGFTSRDSFFGEGRGGTAFAVAAIALRFYSRPDDPGS